ncbi:hypothetical protein LCGC14_1604420 [marine sediment metagenome]|uniref:Uncharacterized protein n=1 Tax=marine sediment metagenome TaxID=412755 RepID=A0A0F9IAA0_9ZZZZ
MDKAVAIEIAGLQCDVDGCDYEDLSIDVNEYEQYVNVPCPDCGAALLTEADHELVKAITNMVDVLNEKYPPPYDPNQPIARFTMKLDGSGVPILGELEWEQ